MSKQPEGAAEASAGGITRLNTNITPATKAAIELVAQDQQINMTEALRRLVAYGLLIYKLHMSGKEILVRNPETGAVERIVII